MSDWARVVKILVSAGEASGDRYAAELVEALRRRLPEAEFFGCAGPRLRAAGVRPVIRAEEIAVVGLVEVVRHIPRIYGCFRKLAAAAREERPALAILTDSPDFHLRLATRLRREGVPVAYYVAPQMWAWRKGRIRRLRRDAGQLLCIFPFEEPFFREHGVEARFVGHPLAGSLRPSLTREKFCRHYGLDAGARLVAMLPGSRRGEAARHLPPLLEAVRLMQREITAEFALLASNTTGRDFFEPLLRGTAVKIIEGDPENLLGHADAALVASGTATVEAALLGAPMVVFYRVSAVSWLLGKLLVDVPFYSMVNLLAGRRIVPELIQGDCNGPKLARETLRLVKEAAYREKMVMELGAIREILQTEAPAAETAAEEICKRFYREPAAPAVAARA